MVAHKNIHRESWDLHLSFANALLQYVQDLQQKSLYFDTVVSECLLSFQEPLVKKHKLQSLCQCSPLSKICCRTAGPWERKVAGPGQKLTRPALHPLTNFHIL